MHSALRGTVATIVVPIAISAGIGPDGYRTPWRAEPSYGATRTSTTIDMGEILRVGRVPVPTAAATTSESVDITESTVGAQTPSLASTTPAEDVALAWLIEPLVKIAELAKLPTANLPNETPIRGPSIASAVQALLDVQDVEGPQPQIIARGDGGLQLVWYTPTRDLEIDVSAAGKLELVEFDGRSTRRMAYSPEAASAALVQIRESLKA